MSLLLNVSYFNKLLSPKRQQQFDQIHGVTSSNLTLSPVD